MKNTWKNKKTFCSGGSCQKRQKNYYVELKQSLKGIIVLFSRNMHSPFTDDEYKKYGTLLAKSVTTDQKCLVEISPSEQRELENL